MSRSERCRFFLPLFALSFCFSPRLSKNRCTYPTVFKSRTYLFLPTTFLPGVHGVELFRRWSGRVQRGYRNRGCNLESQIHTYRY